jgi:hypothetical protein
MMHVGEAILMSRYLARKDQFTEAQRLRLVEDDHDAKDADIAALRGDLQGISRQLTRLLWAVVSLAFTVAGAAVAFAYAAGAAG